MAIAFRFSAAHHRVSRAVRCHNVEPVPVRGGHLVETDEQLDLEFAYTTHRDSCRDMYSPTQYCRRPAGHDGEHASGFGGNRGRWISI